jgi:hypothetical protein
MSKRDRERAMKAKTPKQRKETPPCDEGKGAPQDNVRPPNQFQPGNDFRWQPGESGNPAGRPVTSDIKAEARDFLSECDDPRTGKARLRVLLEIAYRRARQGSAKHLEMLLDRGWGKPLQGIDLDARVDFTDALTRIRERERQRQIADGATAEANGEKPNGHATAATIEQAEEISEAPAVPAERIKRVVV